MLVAMVSTFAASAHTLLADKLQHHEPHLREVPKSSGVMRYAANRRMARWPPRQVILFVVARRLPQPDTHSICTICRRPSRPNV